MDYKTIRKNSTYVTSDETENVNLLGKCVKGILTENDKGSNVTVFYYHSGIEEFDKITNNEPFYEYGLAFHLISFENAFIFRLYHDQKNLYVGKFGIWRDSIIDNPTAHKFMGKVIKNNTLLGAMQTGVFGGLAGAVITVAGGDLISKLRGIKTEDTQVVLYKLDYIHNDEIKTIQVYKKDVFDSDHNYFIGENYTSQLDSKILNESDSRCFIATACYDSENCDELIVFRNFRDQFLINSKFGKLFVEIYYFTSPHLIKILNKSIKDKIKKHFLDKIYLVLKNKYGE